MVKLDDAQKYGLANVAKLWSGILLLAFLIWAFAWAPIWVGITVLAAIFIAALIFTSIDVYRRGFELEETE
jgi:ABC-type sugar transport system permease subunit